jgi:hypothetical protein
MNKKNTKSTKTAGEPSACHPGPSLRELLSRLTPSEEARRHFQTARLEMLKGFRAVLDARIERVTRPKGQKINLE